MSRADFSATQEWLVRLAGADDDQVLAWYHPDLDARYYVRETSAGWEWREGVGDSVSEWYAVDPSIMATRIEPDTAHLIHEDRVPESGREAEGVPFDGVQR